MSIDLVDVPTKFRSAVSTALEAVGVEDGHLAVEIVDEDRIHQLNQEFRNKDKPTDVLSFPVDEDGPSAGPRELGDVIVCPEFCTDVTEAVVHGVLHLCGHDHETDSGEMFVIQDKVMETLDA